MTIPRCLLVPLFVILSAVKPDPPVDVRVSPLNSRSLLVEWSPPPTWANLDIIPLKYQILYRWENRGTPKSVSVRMLFLITNLQCDTLHTQISQVEVQNYQNI